MNTTIFVLFTLASVVALYWFVLRPVLRMRPELAGVYDYLDVAKAGWWAWLQLHLSGLKTKIIARLIGVSSVLVGLHDSIAIFAAGLNWEPVTTRLLAAVPADLRPLVISAAITLITTLFEWLRKISTTPPDVPTQAVVAQVIEKVATAEGRAAEVGETLAKIAAATPAPKDEMAAPITAAAERVA